MASRQQVKDMADRLISTLSGSMASEEADLIVRNVAEELYTEVLGIPGHIAIDAGKPIARVHVGGSRGVKRQAVTVAEYTFLPDKRQGKLSQPKGKG